MEIKGHSNSEFIFKHFPYAINSITGKPQAQIVDDKHFDLI
jgi:hypothetical protein